MVRMQTHGAVPLAETHAYSPDLRMALYMAMRDVDTIDKPEEKLCLGLFADLRTIVVRFHARDTIGGSVLRVREQLRRKRLDVYQGSGTSDVLINVVHKDVGRRSIAPYNEFKFSCPANRKATRWSALWAPLEITMEEDERRWWVRARFAADRYPPRLCRIFTRHFGFVLRAFLECPVMPLEHKWNL